MDQATESQINVKELGEILRGKREEAGFSREQASSMIGVTPEIYANYEDGQSLPTLPELEALCYYFDLLPERFWMWESKPEKVISSRAQVNFPQIARIRQRTIGVFIRQYRIEAGLTSQQIANQLQITEAEIEHYELGEVPIPIDLLEKIAVLCRHSLNDFLDRKSPVGVWAERQRTERALMQLPDDLRVFVSKPINRPFLELAMRLSTMPVKQLREIAEGILEITL
jgi:transcriptional regulator with XRE-family HTH domain